MDNSKFCIFTLEKDMNEFREYREKFTKYDNKLKTCCGSIIFRSCDKEKRKIYYDKYVEKMIYIETTYGENFKQNKFNIIPQATAYYNNLPSAPELN